VTGDEGLIGEQIDYYHRRADEYDETSAPEGDEFEGEGLTLERALHDFRPKGRVLEFACGTGTWTRLLTRYTDQLTALDSSSAMLRLARAKVEPAEVDFVETDLFAWRPDKSYDAVVFANWLSHVPLGRFEDFWSLVRTCLGPGGRVFFVDEAMDAWRKEEYLGEALVRRRLRDGTVHRVVKIFWDPVELRARLQSLGWNARVESTGHFIWGEAKPATERKN
jgi:SAM-dependent methyltransferase